MQVHQDRAFERTPAWHLFGAGFFSAGKAAPERQTGRLSSCELRRLVAAMID